MLKSEKCELLRTSHFWVVRNAKSKCDVFAKCEVLRTSNLVCRKINNACSHRLPLVIVTATALLARTRAQHCCDDQRFREASGIEFEAQSMCQAWPYLLRNAIRKCATVCQHPTARKTTWCTLSLLGNIIEKPFCFARNYRRANFDAWLFISCWMYLLMKVCFRSHRKWLRLYYFSFCKHPSYTPSVYR